jgi:hypothetical protein
LSENLKERDRTGDENIDGRIILKMKQETELGLSNASEYCDA